MPPVPFPYKTLDDHIQLLEEKGYLDAAFGTPAQIGSWLHDFRELFNKAQYDGIGSGRVQPFTKETVGKFHDQIDKVFFELRYQFNPRSDILSLKTVYTRMG